MSKPTTPDVSWVADLKVGDEVIIKQDQSFYSNRREFITKVIKVTDTRLTVGNNCVFYRATGQRYGDMFGDYELIQPTAEALAKLRHDIWRAKTIQYLRDADWSRLTSDQLSALVDSLKTMGFDLFPAPLPKEKTS